MIDIEFTVQYEMPNKLHTHKFVKWFDSLDDALKEKNRITNGFTIVFLKFANDFLSMPCPYRTDVTIKVLKDDKCQNQGKENQEKGS